MSAPHLHLHLHTHTHRLVHPPSPSSKITHVCHRESSLCTGHIQDAGYNLVGAINSLALIIGSSLTDLDNHAGLQLAFRVYRYLTLVHVLNYKEQHRWFRELSMDDFLALGLLTADELPILQVN